MTERERLRRVIRDLHGVDEVVALKGHPKAGLAYAWAQETDEGGRRYVAVLGVEPIKNAHDAVRVSIASESIASEQRKHS